MTQRPPDSITVCVDSREHKPLVFPKYLRVNNGSGANLLKVETSSCKLETADYALLGWEHLSLVERKGSLDELCGNFIGRDSWRFRRVLERMASETRIAWLLLDFAPSSAFRPTKYCKNPDAVLDSVLRACIRYSVRPIWVPPAENATRTGEIVLRLLWAAVYVNEFARPEVPKQAPQIKAPEIHASAGPAVVPASPTSSGAQVAEIS